MGSVFAGAKWGADYFPNTVLTTQDGKKVRFYDDLLKGKSVAVNVIYTSCTDECPLETARMAEVQRLLSDKVGKDIFFYSISIDPEHDTPLAVNRAQYTFESRCASCHAIGGGDRIGPDLRGVTGRRDPAWLARYIREPDKMLAEGDPTAVMLFTKHKQVIMPNLGLDEEDVTLLIAFLKAQDRALLQPVADVKIPAQHGAHAAHQHHKP